MLNIKEHDTEHLPIDKALILAMLQEAVNDYGEDWVDRRAIDPDKNCRNIYQDDEGNEYNCIAGYVFTHNFDFINEGWFKANNLVGQSSNEVIWEMERLTGRPTTELFTSEAMLILEAVQRLQDAGISWGSALQHVRNHLDALKDENLFIKRIKDIVKGHALVTT